MRQLKPARATLAALAFVVAAPVAPTFAEGITPDDYTLHSVHLGMTHREAHAALVEAGFTHDFAQNPPYPATFRFVDLGEHEEREIGVSYHYTGPEGSGLSMIISIAPRGRSAPVVAISRTQAFDQGIVTVNEIIDQVESEFYSLGFGCADRDLTSIEYHWVLDTAGEVVSANPNGRDTYICNNAMGLSSAKIISDDIRESTEFYEDWQRQFSFKAEYGMTRGDLTDHKINSFTIMLSDIDGIRKSYDTVYRARREAIEAEGKPKMEW